MTIWLTYSSFDNAERVHRPHFARWSALLLAAALAVFAFVELAGNWGAQSPLSGVPVDARGAGVFNGEFVDGVPVYRLPSITVVAERDAVIARMHRNDAPPRAKPTRG